MIQLTNVSVSYHQHTILKHITSSIPSAQITSIIGPNGSGKSTLLKALIKLLPVSSGQITINQQDLQTYSHKQLSQRISYMPQLREIPQTTVYSLLQAGRYPYRQLFQRLSANDHDMINEALLQINIMHLKDKSLHDLSGGERQKVYLALMLVQNTDIILLDEPTTYLDLNHQFELLALVQLLKSRGKTIIMVLHDLAQALTYSDHIIVLNEGQLITNSSPNELIKTSVFIDIFKLNLLTLESNKTKYYQFSPL